MTDLVVETDADPDSNCYYFATSLCDWINGHTIEFPLRNQTCSFSLYTSYNVAGHDANPPTGCPAGFVPNEDAMRSYWDAEASCMAAYHNPGDCVDTVVNASPCSPDTDHLRTFVRVNAQVVCPGTATIAANPCMLDGYEVRIGFTIDIESDLELQCGTQCNFVETVLPLGRCAGNGALDKCAPWLIAVTDGPNCDSYGFVSQTWSFTTKNHTSYSVRFSGTATLTAVYP